METFRETEARLRRIYGYPKTEKALAQPKGIPTGDGFLTEVAGRVIFSAPASTLTTANDLPDGMAERWEKASQANPYFTWVRGRFVEAEQANGNGAFWSTADLQFGEMSVRHGPLNWLHEAKKVIGTIADNALILPDTEQAAVQRPYIAAVSAVWKWVYSAEAALVEQASDMNRLWYSMECVSREVSCVGDNGCGESFPYMKAIQKQACDHINEPASTRRFVDPSFLGGAVIVPPVRPGWANANAEVMRQAAALAEQTYDPAARWETATEWETLMAAVLASVT